MRSSHVIHPLDLLQDSGSVVAVFRSCFDVSHPRDGSDKSVTGVGVGLLPLTAGCSHCLPFLCFSSGSVGESKLLGCRQTFRHQYAM